MYRCRSFSHMNAMIHVHATRYGLGLMSRKTSKRKQGPSAEVINDPPQRVRHSLVPSGTEGADPLENFPESVKARSITDREPTKMVIRLNRLL